MSEPIKADWLVDAIKQARSTWSNCGRASLTEWEAEIVYAHLAAVLDAEEARWECDWRRHREQVGGAVEAVADIRSALGVAPTDREGG